MLGGVPQGIPHRVQQPTGPVQQMVDPVLGCLPVGLGQLPAVLARDGTQQALSVDNEGVCLVAEREQGSEAVQVGLQGMLELEQVVAGQLRCRRGNDGRGGIPWVESDSGNLPHDFSLQWSPAIIVDAIG